ncbi:unnamed protein product, partial [marine sediment metagenome]
AIDSNINRKIDAGRHRINLKKGKSRMFRLPMTILA